MANSDGVGDSQLTMCKEYELKQLKDCCKAIDETYSPKFTFIVVQKRVNARLFSVGIPHEWNYQIFMFPENSYHSFHYCIAQLDEKNKPQNPNPGAVLDHSVTRRQMYDFYLVPQSVRQGTVTPTHYIVVEDESDFDADIVQRMSYKLCFLYYNWPGEYKIFQFSGNEIMNRIDRKTHLRGNSFFLLFQERFVYRRAVSMRTSWLHWSEHRWNVNHPRS